MGDTDVVRIEISRYESENSSGEHCNITNLAWQGMQCMPYYFTNAQY